MIRKNPQAIPLSATVDNQSEQTGERTNPNSHRSSQYNEQIPIPELRGQQPAEIVVDMQEQEREQQ